MDKIYQGNYKITSSFGARELSSGDNRFHYGEDHVGLTSKAVVSPTSGRVVTSTRIFDKSNSTWEWGNYIKVDDLNGFYLFFCHLASRLVYAGQRVTEGQPIGVEGSTGYSEASHCHFEVRRKSDGKSINPREYFKILAEWELKDCRDKTQQRFGFDDNTMKYFDEHPYPLALYKKLSTTK